MPKLHPDHKSKLVHMSYMVRGRSFQQSVISNAIEVAVLFGEDVDEAIAAAADESDKEFLGEHRDEIAFIAHNLHYLIHAGLQATDPHDHRRRLFLASQI